MRLRVLIQWEELCLIIHNSMCWFALTDASDSRTLTERNVHRSKDSVCFVIRVRYKHDSFISECNCAFTPQAARASKWPEIIHFQCEPAARSSESGAARFGRWRRRGELKSGQLYGNELWRGSAATNQNVEVLRLRGVQRTQSCKLWFRPH